MKNRAHHDRLWFFGADWLPVWVLFVLALFNIAFLGVFSDFESLPEWLEVVLLGAWMFEPMVVAAWTALAPGALVIRLSLAVPSIMLLIAAQGILPGGFKHIELYELKVIAIAGFVMFAADLILILILRRLFGWHLEPPGESRQQANPRFQFGVRYLLILLTLCAIVLGIVSNRAYKPPPQPTFAFIIFGPEFFLHIVIIAGITAFFALRPLTAVPLIVLSAKRSKRATRWALGVWGLTSVIVIAVFFALGESIEDVLLGGLLLQSGAVLLGASTAWLLRRAGYRLRPRN